LRVSFDKQVQVAELLFSLSLDKKRAFFDLLCKVLEVESTLHSSKLKALGFPLKPGPTEATKAANGNNKRTVFSSKEMEDSYIRGLSPRITYLIYIDFESFTAMVKIVSYFYNSTTVFGSSIVIGERVVASVAYNFFDK
jgi:hypothetical protein